MEKEYYLGLDIGTGSVGWAVTDPSYQLCQYKKKDMWGIRLFDKAEPAEERRMYRRERRKMERRKQRIDLLQELFAEEMAKVDDTFFIRLNESRLYQEDKQIQMKHPLFNDLNFTDQDYYKMYPTIYHLRKALLEGDAKQDIRLVYLALHHIIKHRGHFFIYGDLQETRNASGLMQMLLEALRNECSLDFYLDQAGLDEFKKILKSKEYGKSEKAKRLLALFAFDGPDGSLNKLQKQSIEQVCKWIAGMPGDIGKFLSVNPETIGIEKAKFSFSEAQYEADIAGNLEMAIPEQFYVIENMKLLHDWGILSDILSGETYISYAKVKQYQIHEKNLKTLRNYMKQYCDKHTCEQFFDAYEHLRGTDKLHNYAAYIGSVKKHGKHYPVERCTAEEFYKNLEKILKSTEPADYDKPLKEKLLRETAMQTLLPLQRSLENRAVPKQVHELELRKILKLAGQYLPFLNNIDDDGVSVSEKIIAIFNFKIPNYVGPLSDRHRENGSNSWMVRKEGQTGRIYPWNFDKIVNLEKTNVAFIERVTNKCSYLIGEDVLPAHSMLYQACLVLDELNTLKIRGDHLPPALKHGIFENVFLKHTRVTIFNVLEYLNQLEQYADPHKKIRARELSGVDLEFKTSMSSYLDFEKQIFGSGMKDESVQVMAENIIKWITVYGDNKEMLKRTIQQYYPEELTEEQLKAVLKFKYRGWSPVSRTFLSGIYGADIETGERFTIMKSLWKTENSLTELLSSRFTFLKEIDIRNREITVQLKEISYELLVKDLYMSAAMKRSIWQTIQIAEELKKVMGHTPAKIFLATPPGGMNERKKKQKDVSRKQQLLILYAACKNDGHNWIREIEDKQEREFYNNKVYLYYLQKGRCLYTGEPIDFDNLMCIQSKWDKDHIYPQSVINDDSLDNLVLVDKNVNAQKGRGRIPAEIVEKQHTFWKELLDGGFLSKKKYDRLTRTNDFQEEELADFIAQQLIDTKRTSQIAKNLLEQIYPNTAVIPVRADLVAQFRQKDLRELKSRRVNDLHHAKDAYLNIVVGNVYDEKFSPNPIDWIRKNNGDNYHINRVFEFDVRTDNRMVWQAPQKDEKGNVKRGENQELIGGTIDIVRETMHKNRMFYTEYSYCEKGELFAANPKHVDNAYIPLKAGLDPKKYGGYYRPKTSYFALVEFDGQKQERKKHIVGVPIYIANMLPHKPDAFIRYCEDVKGLKNVRILYDKIQKNALLKVDGFPLRIRKEFDTQIGFKMSLQLVLTKEDEKTVRFMEKYLEKNLEYEVDEAYDKLTDARLDHLYDTLLEKFQTVYAKRPANKGQELLKKRDIFLKKDKKTKVLVLNEILQMLRCDIDTMANLKEIGGKAASGSIAIYKNTICKNKLVLIHQSVTGIFENRVELIT